MGRMRLGIIVVVVALSFVTGATNARGQGIYWSDFHTGAIYHKA